MNNADPKETAKLFYRELEKINSNEALDLSEKNEALFRLTELIFIHATGNQGLQFTTLFARMAYAFHQYDIPKRSQYFVHLFRRKYRKKVADEPQKIFDLGLRVTTGIIENIYSEPPHESLRSALPVQWPFPFSSPEIKAFKSRARVLILEDDEDKSQFVARDQERPDNIIRVQYNIPDRNENFNPTIRVIRSSFGLPVTVNLIDTQIDKDNVYRPKAFVVEPDYLTDVTAVAECFKDFGTEPVLYLLKKFLPFEQTKHTLLGHIANFFLDEIMNDPEANFRDTFPKVFHLNPLAWAAMDDSIVREIYNNAKSHWVHLKSSVIQDFKRQGINSDECYLEPSFYSEKYGLQGRLDVFYKDGKKSAIVELKSGSVWKPNQYKIAHNHFTQTLLYDLMIRSVFGKEADPQNYILYSKEELNQLRYAPRVKAQQYEALQLRNQLVGLEKRLAGLYAGTPPTDARVGSMDGKSFFSFIRPGRYPKLTGFNGKDLELFEGVWSNMSVLERDYFTAFTAFIANEHQLAKTGQQGRDRANGAAALWLDNLSEKEEKFNIISGLTIHKEQVQDDEPLITFKRTPGRTNPLANFRKGDIAILYPADNESDTVLQSQIFKSNIIEITKESITITLRFRQFNNRVFTEHTYWNLEHDLMDSGYTAMYRGLFAFMRSPNHKRNLWLSLSPPNKPKTLEITAPSELTQEQQQIFKKAISAQDYFLLWGPPGTGKTSKMLKNLVAWLIENTEENILLLAYTNRAVDEISEAINSIENLPEPGFLRLGNKYSTAPQWRDNLLSTQTAGIKKRDELRGIIQSHRIFVGTVAGFANKATLLHMKKFDRVIIDEASQILEPNLLGLLPRFEQVMLIGDHQQLPAVVVQNEKVSECKNEDLHGIGLKNLRNSLFERLYLRCIEMKWDWAYDRLSHQGRMHEDIMCFPNEAFYKGGLKILPAEIPFSLTQKSPLAYKLPSDATELENTLATKRFIFLPTRIDGQNANPKTNVHEAKLLAKLVKSYQRIYQENNMDLTEKSIGIITPYRAQIAQIQEILEQDGQDLSKITIDTVERYQGGARDIILISLCTNSINQLASLVSVSEEGVDRKLNVALTRARQHVVILGNEEILRVNGIYGGLIDFCGG